MALLAICFACSTFMVVLLFRGVLAPFTPQRGSKDAKQETGAKRIGASRSERVALLSDTDFRGARDASGDRRRNGLHAWTRAFRSGKNRRAREAEACGQGNGR